MLYEKQKFIDSRQDISASNKIIVILRIQKNFFAGYVKA